TELWRGVGADLEHGQAVALRRTRATRPCSLKRDKDAVRRRESGRSCADWPRRNGKARNSSHTAEIAAVEKVCFAVLSQSQREVPRLAARRYIERHYVGSAEIE